MDKPLPQTLSAGSTSDKRVTLERLHVDIRKVQSIILASTSNDIQKQYDRLDHVASILQRMKEVYAFPNGYTRYVDTKEFFRNMMAEGSFVQEHGVKMLSLARKLENLKVGLNNNTYIDMILQLLPPFFESFIINSNMNGLEKTINELINMLEWARERGRRVLLAEVGGKRYLRREKGHWNRDCLKLPHKQGAGKKQKVK
ncbi:UNVERIFIED_CONTAM: hypothetical protein Sindi_2276000 [Sesamum indicum]